MWFAVFSQRVHVYIHAHLVLFSQPDKLRLLILQTERARLPSRYIQQCLSVDHIDASLHCCDSTKALYFSAQLIRSSRSSLSCLFSLGCVLSRLCINANHVTGKVQDTSFSSCQPQRPAGQKTWLPKLTGQHTMSYQTKLRCQFSAERWFPHLKTKSRKMMMTEVQLLLWKECDSWVA